MTAAHVVLVSCARTVGLARASARAATLGVSGTIWVLDSDATYRPVAGERVLTPDAIDRADAPMMAQVLEPDELSTHLLPAAAAMVSARHPDAPVTVLEPGVVVLEDLVPQTGAAVAVATRGVPAADEPDGAWPRGLDSAHGPFLPVATFAPGRAGELELWHGEASSASSWQEALAAGPRAAAVMLPVASAWTLGPVRTVDLVEGRLRVDGELAAIVDLSHLDAANPWLLDRCADTTPRVRLSALPDLRGLVVRLLDDDGPHGTAETPVFDAGTRMCLRRAWERGEATPPVDARSGLTESLVEWLLSAEDGSPSRWLLGLRKARPDLLAAFPDVPGRDTPHLVEWAAKHGRDEGYPSSLLPALPPRRRRPARAVLSGAASRVRVASRPRPAPGVTVVGFLRGELGIGESARQMVSALDAVGVPCSTVTLEPATGTRNTAPFVGHVDSTVRAATVLCVNADLTPSVAASVPHHLERSRRIGMWYWEVEEFPVSQHGGFEPLDEIWVATDFVREAVARCSPVPVHTVTPPLPQRGPDPTVSRGELGLPDRPLLLFSFDFLSTAERKNPWGLVRAFRQAFAPEEGPVLVVKSINADRRPAEAEHLRSAAAERTDILLLEDYLDARGRDALVAHCDAYVSLHRSEGLGLTMAEAMAWGKPVIATGYSGNLQFMTDDNSFLVPWTPVPIPPRTPPYPSGGTWAEPDLDEAARLMRLVLTNPTLAAARGARAARDIATLHSARAAGEAITARLRAGDAGGRGHPW